ncbi:uridine-cytidine kinase-like 1 isoform X2 [Xenia sp. Carnegie-2017]|uniref:uridine-cytidine kinase-like 1 isoform X2 n=1 Tax=Xenia sp. Carnegie-2017 TaxID=2897299 RepID=UPI001F046F3B|nr:uridine-cytidine kinase-like 1 isoform X2 [Xenia sp. Carnegie-2017]
MSSKVMAAENGNKILDLSYHGKTDSNESLDRLSSASPPRKGLGQRQKDKVLRHGNRTIYTAGRPPWYNSQGQLKEAFVIGICGGSASGKTTVAKKIIEDLGVPWVCLLSMDSFYKVLTHEQHEQALKNQYNFDRPESFDFDIAVETLKKLKVGKSVQVPIYDFNTHKRLKDVQNTMYGANVIIFEGIMAFCNDELCKLMDTKIFVDTDADIRLARRLKRDISERGRDLNGVLQQYNKFVKPSFEKYIAPSMTCADIVVPRGGENLVAINMIVRHVKQKLSERGFYLRPQLISAHQGQRLPNSLHVVETTPQVRGVQTIIRDKRTSRDDFIFYSKRFMRIVIEYALSFLPFEDYEVKVNGSHTYCGKRFAGKRISGVSILRAGETMEPALESLCKDVRIGKILIQTNENTQEPELHFLRLPRDIHNDHVILLDATLASGAAGS